MLRTCVCLLAVSLAATAAVGSDLNVSVECTNNEMTTGPGCVVNYTIYGELSDTANEGLALVGFDLELVQPNGSPNPPQAGALPQTDEWTDGPMFQFVKPQGITNPAGFGGTPSSGKLLQVGGGQNTIMNGQVACTGNQDCPTGSTCNTGLCTPVAPYPVGTVVTGVAKGGKDVLVTGSFTAPNTPGTYELRLSNLFANVIRQGEDGNPFWATDQAGVGTISSLTVIVDAGSPCNSCSGASIVDSYPAKNDVDARQPHPVDNAGNLQGVTQVDLIFSGTPLADDIQMADFQVTSTGGTPPTIVSVSPLAGDTVTVQLSSRLVLQQWTIIEHVPSGSRTCIGFLPGDVNGSFGTNVQDITALIDSLNNVITRPDYATDINRSGATNVQDITAVIDLLNGAEAFDPWNAQTLPALPAECN